MLAIVTVLIAFNKVGSPQYIAWLAAPVILGIIMSGRRFLTPAVLVGITAGLTQLFYPYLYQQLLDLNAWMLAVVTLRNLMLFVVLGWAVVALWRTGTRARSLVPASTKPAERGVWPLEDGRGAASVDSASVEPGSERVRLEPTADELFPHQV